MGCDSQLLDWQKRSNWQKNVQIDLTVQERASGPIQSFGPGMGIQVSAPEEMDSSDMFCSSDSSVCSEQIATTECSLTKS
mmetsp:Transcript_21391/g.53019  ORF Transcript_21391/g.53019 Transcript_21391/m.53019 type:complete len:80 (+) Transcript_21391:2291-2530(+)